MSVNLSVLGMSQCGNLQNVILNLNEMKNALSWASPNTDEPPPWAPEDGKDKLLNQSFEIPFYGYLLASAITAIAAIGSAFEYVNQKPVFGLLNSDSIFHAPLLGFFAFTGIPTLAFLWFKSVQEANKEAEEQIGGIAIYKIIPCDLRMSIDICSTTNHDLEPMEYGESHFGVNVTHHIAGNGTLLSNCCYTHFD